MTSKMIIYVHAIKEFHKFPDRLMDLELSVLLYNNNHCRLANTDQLKFTTGITILMLNMLIACQSTLIYCYVIHHKKDLNFALTLLIKEICRPTNLLHTVMFSCY